MRKSTLQDSGVGRVFTISFFKTDETTKRFTWDILRSFVQSIDTSRRAACVSLHAGYQTEESISRPIELQLTSLPSRLEAEVSPTNVPTPHAVIHLGSVLSQVPVGNFITCGRSSSMIQIRDHACAHPPFRHGVELVRCFESLLVSGRI